MKKHFNIGFLLIVVFGIFSCAKLQYAGFNDTKSEVESIKMERKIWPEKINPKGVSINEKSEAINEIILKDNTEKIAASKSKNELKEQKKEFKKKFKKILKEVKENQKALSSSKSTKVKKKSDFNSWWGGLSPILRVGLIFIGAALIITFVANSQFVMGLVWVVCLILLAWGLIETYA